MEMDALKEIVKEQSNKSQQAPETEQPIGMLVDKWGVEAVTQE